MFNYIVTFQDNFGTHSRLLVSELELSNDAIKYYYKDHCQVMFCRVYSIEKANLRSKIVKELLEFGRTDTFCT